MSIEKEDIQKVTDQAKAGILAALAHNPWPVIAGALVLGFVIGALLL